MPIYEYHCTACGCDLEKLQKINDPLLVDCPECGKSSLLKQVSAAGFKLSGSGWYETDFKNKAKPDAKTEKSPNVDKPVKKEDNKAKES